jgi:hypothetical protein
MITDEKINADAQIASRYLKALLMAGVEHADAVSLTGNYMFIRSSADAQATAAVSAARGSGSVLS